MNDSHRKQSEEPKNPCQLSEDDEMIDEEYVKEDDHKAGVDETQEE